MVLVWGDFRVLEIESGDGYKQNKTAYGRPKYIDLESAIVIKYFKTLEHDQATRKYWMKAGPVLEPATITHCSAPAQCGCGDSNSNSESS